MKKQRYNIMMNPKLHEELKVVAEAMGISVSALINLVMANYMADKKNPNGSARIF